MAQHDYIIANQSGAAFRSDLNNGLAAIVSQNSGAAQPSTTYAYQWWADTTTGLLKIRNAANSAWITVGTLADANLGLATLASPTFTGNVTINAQGEGTSSPAELLNVNGNIALDTAVLNTPKFLQFRANSNGSGTPSYGGITWYNFQWDATKRAEISSGPDGSVAAGYLAFSTGSVGITEHMRISAAGSVGIGTTSPGELLELSATTDPKIQFTDVGNVISKIGISTSTALTFEHNGSERARIDSSGRLLVGTSSNSGGALLQVNGNRIRIATANTPASAGATGTTGEIAWDANYIYVCTATNTWKRTAIATW